jgi:hypothetical protein
VRLNVSLAISLLRSGSRPHLSLGLSPSFVDVRARALASAYAPARAVAFRIQSVAGAHDRIRTGDLVLTKDVLYLLSYVGNPCRFTQRSGFAAP